MKTKQKKKSSFFYGLSPCRRAHPFVVDALGDGTHHSRLPVWRDVTCLLKWASTPLPWFVCSPSERTNHLSGWEGILKLEKNWFVTFQFRRLGNIGLMWVGGLAMDWDLGYKTCFLLALGRGCSPVAIYHVFVTYATTTFWLMDDIITNRSRRGHFGSALKHLGVACGWGFCWLVATAASMWNVLILSLWPVPLSLC